MAKGRSYSVDNPDALANAIAGLDSRTAESALRKAAAAGATEYKKEVALRVPRETGDLAAGLTVAYDQEDSVAGAVATYIVTFVGNTRERGRNKRKVSRRALARWLENGTSTMPARPFVRPAFEAAKRRAADKINERLTTEANAVKQQ
ncbi:HK97-gp10 family putative phage morphogenesis protein [Burkholderia ubonensis]|uniref:HK97-gp10 family putative phage morphogenesis protein n=1 Tax=Burkholderia ubonensis TaxID=101571 RepID=UPI0009B45BBF|nr:HK97-gp10 family putative phage morphogenesis protein [Burkholderia ubonensis]